MDEIETKDQGNRMERGHPPSLIRAITGETDIHTGAVTRIRRGTIRSEECITGDVIIGIIRHLGGHSSITGETTMPHRYSTETQIPSVKILKLLSCNQSETFSEG
jgi:hypothetical protein